MSGHVSARQERILTYLCEYLRIQIEFVGIRVGESVIISAYICIDCNQAWIIIRRFIKSLEDSTVGGFLNIRTKLDSPSKLI